MLNEDAVLSKKEFKKDYPEIALREEEFFSGDCDCRWDITCQISGLGDCSDDSCEDTTFGCGWLFSQSCTGDCSG